MNFIGTGWALLPAVVAIVLALKTKEVYISLFIGIFIGALLFNDFHLFKQKNLYRGKKNVFRRIKMW